MGRDNITRVISRGARSRVASFPSAKSFRDRFFPPPTCTCTACAEREREREIDTFEYRPLSSSLKNHAKSSSRRPISRKQVIERFEMRRDSARPFNQLEGSCA